MFIKDKKDIILKLLYKFHTKLSRFELDSKNFYLLFFLIKLNIIRYSLNEIIIKRNKFIKFDCYINTFFYYIYIFFFLKIYDISLIEKILFKSNIFLPDNILMIFIEDKIRSNINLLPSISTDYFLKNKLSTIILYNEYKLSIDLLNLLIYERYIEHIRISIYNEYLTFMDIFMKYPLLKTFLRFVLYKREKKVNIFFNNLNNSIMSSKYNIYDHDDLYNLVDNNLVYNNYKVSSSVMINIVNNNLIKYISLWKNQRFYFFIDYIFNKYIKYNVLLLSYHIHYSYFNDDIFADLDNYHIDCNKLNILGPYSLYWQMNRYGFTFNYYFYLNGIISTFLQNNINYITQYNLYYLKFIVHKDNHFYWIFWYKTINLILLNHIFNIYFKYIKLRRFTYIRRRTNFIRKLVNWKVILQTFTFLFFPLNLNIYDDSFYLVRNLNKKRDLFNNVFIYMYSYDDKNIYKSLDYDIINISKKIHLDNVLFKNFDFYLNLSIFFILKKIGIYFFINFIGQFITIKGYVMKSVNILNLIYLDNNYYKDMLKKHSREYYFFLENKYRGLNIFTSYFNRYKNEYLWDFEKSMRYISYMIIIDNYYHIMILYLILSFLRS